MDKTQFMQTEWFKRALNPKTPATANPHQEPHTLLTASYDYKGKIILVPTLRMIKGKLTYVKNPVQIAIDKNDYLEGFSSHDEAKHYSLAISDAINVKRKAIVANRK